MDGSIAHYKARLLAKEFSQKLRFNFQDTFNSVVKFATVRIVLSLALCHKCSLRQIDMNNVFLHGDISEEVFMFQPPGFE